MTGTCMFKTAYYLIKWHFLVPLKVTSTTMITPANTHLLYRRKYHCTDDLLFYLFGFSYFAHVELATDLLVWSNPNPSSLAESNLVKLETIRTVILPPTVSVL